MIELVVLPDAEALAQAVAERFRDAAQRAVEARGLFSVALAGGSTPRPAYERLAAEPLIQKVPWKQLHVFWGDERCVPPDHPDSNYRMASGALLSKVPIPVENVHRIHGEAEPAKAATLYRDELKVLLGPEPRFDLILLGLGTDGHTASLFPGTSAMEEREQSVVAVYVERLDAWRVTLTLPVIERARRVCFVVSGERKAAVLARIWEGERLPAARVDPKQGELLWLVYQAAASEIPHTT